jgi:plasmid stabilization system protein ParE
VAPGYLLTHLARTDLLTIIDFVATHNPAAAGDLLDDFFQAFERLVQHSNLGHKRSDLTAKPFRFWPVHSYLIIYNSNVSPIEIYRLLSGYRDLTNVLLEA